LHKKRKKFHICYQIWLVIPELAYIMVNGYISTCVVFNVGFLSDLNCAVELTNGFFEKNRIIRK
jgi:hypothetical protein